jgi:hypothetical protein
MAQIAVELEKTATAFRAQCRRRDILLEKMRHRLKIKQDLEFEHFFFRYFDDMDVGEKFDFQQIRAITEGQLHSGNETLLRLIESQPEIIESVPQLADLRQHLVFWLNKYDKFFINHPRMCLLYTGVEDGVPFPAGVEIDVHHWLTSNR